MGIAEITLALCVKDDRLVRYGYFRQDNCAIANQKMILKIFRLLVDDLSAG